MAAPVTPFGTQQGFREVTAQDVINAEHGLPITGPVVPQATRAVPFAPSYNLPGSGQIQLNPQYSGNGLTTPTVGAIAPVKQGTYADVAQKLGNDWQQRMQNALAKNDWTTYYAIENQVNSILYPTH